MCYNLAEAFESRFGSLLCRDLRPEGFKPDNPPHLCEDLTREAILFDVDLMTEQLSRPLRLLFLKRVPLRLLFLKRVPLRLLFLKRGREQEV